MSDLRMPEINDLIIAGRLTRDPRTSTTGGTAWAGFAIAVDKHWTSDGVKKESVSFHECKAWRGAAEQIGRLHKGDPVILEGSVEQEILDLPDGKTQSKTRIYVRRVQVLSWPEKSTDAGNPAPIPEDDIPF